MGVGYPGPPGLTCAKPGYDSGHPGRSARQRGEQMKAKVNFKAELERIKKEHARIERVSVESRTKFAVESLQSVTPVLTGYAASRWTHEMEDGVGVITNDAPYIDRLNEGHSKQAPPKFIELTLMAIGELEYPVYTTTP